MTNDAQAIAKRLPSIMWKHIYTGAMGTTYMHLSFGMFLVAYGRMLGVGYRAFGILGGLSSFVVVLQLFGAHISAKIGSRRGLWFACAMGERLMRGLAIASAYYLSGGNVVFTSTVFVVLLALGSAVSSLAVPPWFSWMADLIPERIQGTFWGRRESWVTFAAMIVLLPCALLFDWAKRTDMALQVLLIIFAIGLLFGYVDLFIHKTIPEPAMKRTETPRMWAGVTKVLRDERFRPWIVFSLCWNFSLMLAASMCLIYFVDNLFENNFTNGVLAIMIAPMAIRSLTSKHTGKLVDRFGTRRVLTWGHHIWALIPLPWLFATPETAVYILTASSAISMPAASVAMNAGIKYVTRFPKPEDRAMYWAVANSLGRIAAGCGALCAGEVLEAFKNTNPSVAGVSFTGFHVLFVVSVILRLTSAQLTRRLPELECEKVARESNTSPTASCA